MKSRNQYHGINPYAVQLVRFKARQLSRHPFFGPDGVEDLEQEMMIHLHRKMPAFDPNRASLNTFIARVVENRAASLAAMASAQSRNAGHPDISWEEMRESGHGDEAEASVDPAFHPAMEEPDAMAASIDLRRCIQRLSREQRRLCQMLPFHPSSAISREMGWSRATYFRRVASLRETFRQAGLGNFMAAA